MSKKILHLILKIPIPELYIEIVKTPGTRVVDFQLKTKDGVIFNPNIWSSILLGVWMWSHVREEFNEF